MRTERQAGLSIGFRRTVTNPGIFGCCAFSSPGMAIALSSEERYWHSSTETHMQLCKIRQLSKKPNSLFCRHWHKYILFLILLAVPVAFNAPLEAAGLLIADGGNGGILE